MLTQIAENSALFPGLAIATFTVYQIISSYIQKRITKRVKRQTFGLRLHYLLTLGKSLAYNSNNVYEDAKKNISPDSHIPDRIIPKIEELLFRAQMVIEFSEKWQNEYDHFILSSDERNLFLDFYNDYQTYHQVLLLRRELLKQRDKSLPDLNRFNSVAHWNFDKMEPGLSALANKLVPRSDSNS